MPRPAHVFALLLGVALLAAGRGRAQQSPPPCSADSRVWCPATFRGLVMGRATVDDAVRALGKPRATVAATGVDGLMWLGFDVAGDLPGQASVWADPETRVVQMVVVHPGGMSRDAAERLFGAGFLETRYAPDECAEGDVVPIYEAPNGPLLQVEYRNRGIALSVTDAVAVHEVLYLARPVSEPRSSCAPGADATA